jgi:hypothetical protein
MFRAISVRPDHHRDSNPGELSLVVTPLLKAEAAFPVSVHEKRRRPKEGNQSWHFQIESRSSPSRGSSAGLARDPV